MRAGTILLAFVGFAAASASPALAQRFPFERSLEITGPSKLDVSTIRGKIDITPGEPGRIIVAGTVTVRVGWNVPANALQLARKVADNPPIHREGQTVRLRPPAESEEQRAVTVSYQVRVPPDADVHLVSESGATTVRGVGRALSVRTQSSAIDLTGIAGPVTVTTGSGDVVVDDVAASLTVTTSSSRITARSVAGDLRVRTETGAVDVTLTGEGDADVETGSSGIRLRGVRGGSVIATRSGRVSLQGVPQREWLISTGSGGVDIAIESSAPFSVDASTGAGSVKITGATVQGATSKRTVKGEVAGGGPLVKVATRSGSIVMQVGAVLSETRPF